MKAPELDVNSVPRRAASASWRDVAGEMVVLDTKGRMLRGLNATASAAWSLADGSRTIAEIAHRIARSAGPGAHGGRVESDVLEFFRKLCELGLVEI